MKQFLLTMMITLMALFIFCACGVFAVSLRAV